MAMTGKEREWRGFLRQRTDMVDAWAALGGAEEDVAGSLSEAAVEDGGS